MNLQNDQELANTERKLDLLEKQIDIATQRSPTDVNAASLRSLTQMANQLCEEIVRYHSQQQRRAS
jgi:hypothetical protein